MRLPAALATLSLLAGVFGADHAAAVVTVEIVWTATTGPGTPGGSSIAARPGDVLTAQLRVAADAAGVCCAAVSVEFDRDLGDELDLVSATELSFAPLSPLTPGVEGSQESDGAQLGRVLTIESFSPAAPGPVSSSFALGEITFEVTANVVSDGDDVFTGFFHGGVDAIGGNDSLEVPTVDFRSASVERAPGAVPALGLWWGLGAVLALASAGVAVLRRSD